jgi:hypothetical protein
MAEATRVDQCQATTRLRLTYGEALLSEDGQIRILIAAPERLHYDPEFSQFVGGIELDFPDEQTRRPIVDRYLGRRRRPAELAGRR